MGRQWIDEDEVFEPKMVTILWAVLIGIAIPVGAIVLSELLKVVTR